MEDNTSSECIHTVAATYGCEVLQMYGIRNEGVRIRIEVRMSADMNRSANETPILPVYAT